MYSIAVDFGISLDNLLAANPMTDPNNIAIGDQIVIPGLQGISGFVVTQNVGYGDSLRSLSRRAQVSESVLRKLNHITSPFELFAGFKLILPQKENFVPLTHGVVLAPGESLLEAAVRENRDPWALVQTNELGGRWDGAPGDLLFSASESTDTSPSTVKGGMPSAFIDVSVAPLPMTQGTTNIIKVKTHPGVTLNGTLVDMPLHFFPSSENNYVALQGVFAMLEPGLYPLKLEASLPDGRKQSFEQRVQIQSGYYPDDPMLSVDPETIDPAITLPENQQIATIASPATPAKLWQGMFQLPVAEDYCTKSRFGSRRAYNGGTYDSFHGGLDFGVCSAIHPFDIYAPADGVVVFTGQLTVRGNATIIDHGWGVYTGYWHQEEILVNVGDHVTTGQLIGKIGKTGRVTGPHLHWEVWVNGIQVNPAEWLNNTYP